MKVCPAVPELVFCPSEEFSACVSDKTSNWLKKIKIIISAQSEYIAGADEHNVITAPASRGYSSPVRSADQKPPLPPPPPLPLPPTVPLIPCQAFIYLFFFCFDLPSIILWAFRNTLITLEVREQLTRSRLAKKQWSQTSRWKTVSVIDSTS